MSTKGGCSYSIAAPALCVHVKLGAYTLAATAYALDFAFTSNSGVGDPQVTAAAHIPVSYTILRLSRALELSSAAAVAGEWMACL